MANRTTHWNQPLSQAADETQHTVLGANQSIPYGTFAVNDSGVIKAYTAALMGGGAVFLGFAQDQNLVNTTGSSVTFAQPFKFRRGCPALCDAYTGDEPTISDVGKTVYLRENFSVGKTNPGSCTPVILLAMPSTGTQNKYRVKLP